VSCHATVGPLDNNDLRISRDFVVRVAASAAHPANLINVIDGEISRNSWSSQYNEGTERAVDVNHGDD
jgi:hypothetical protein